MIDNFDQLIARCQAKRRRYTVRIAFIITGVLLLAGACFGAYQLWLDSKAAPASAVSKKVAVLPQKPKSPIRLMPQNNETQPLPSSAPVCIVPASAPKIIHVPPSVSSPAVIKPSAADVPVLMPNTNLFEVNTPNDENPVDAYSKRPTYETALAAARDFYAKKNFIDAAIWAKEANRINREGEESWLLYAKSVHAQGRSDEAIGILELYLNYKNSKAAAELVKTWR